MTTKTIPVETGPATLKALAAVAVMNQARNQVALKAIESGKPFTAANAQEMAETLRTFQRDHAAQKDSEIVAATVERALGVGRHD